MNEYHPCPESAIVTWFVLFVTFFFFFLSGWGGEEVICIIFSIHLFYIARTRGKGCTWQPPGIMYNDFGWKSNKFKRYSVWPCFRLNLLHLKIWLCICLLFWGLQVIQNLRIWLKATWNTRMIISIYLPIGW